MARDPTGGFRASPPARWWRSKRMRAPLARRAPADGPPFHRCLRSPRRVHLPEGRAVRRLISTPNPRNGDTVRNPPGRGRWPGSRAPPGCCDRLADRSTCASTPTTPPDHHTSRRPGSASGWGNRAASSMSRPGPASSRRHRPAQAETPRRPRSPWLMAPAGLCFGWDTQSRRLLALGCGEQQPLASRLK